MKTAPALVNGQKRMRHSVEVVSPRGVVVIAHGLGEHMGRYQEMAVRLADAHMTVVGIDHLGHGSSPGARALIANLATVEDDLAAIVTQERTKNPGVPVVLLGHSLGGLIAIRCVQRFPGCVDGLVLSSPVAGRWRPEPGLDIPPIPSRYLSRIDAQCKAYEGDPAVWKGAIPAATSAAISRAVSGAAADGELPDIPTLWLHGTSDRLARFSDAAYGMERMANRQLVTAIFGGGHHELFNDECGPAALSKLISFLDAYVLGHEASPTLGATSYEQFQIKS